MDVLILAGKRPRPGTILDEVQASLAVRGLHAVIEWRDPLGATEAERFGLLVHRGLAQDTLTRLAALLAARGLDRSVINTPSACLAAADRAVALRVLRRAGLAVPESRVETDWAAVIDRAQRGGVYVKALSGAAGRGAGVVMLPRGAAAEPPFPGPWHVEDVVPNDGVDRKLYVMGQRVSGLLKTWPRGAAPDRPFEPDVELVDLAQRVGQATGLELFGLDLVGRSGAFAVVDLNPFPGYRGVEGAAEAVADHIAIRAATTG